MSKPKPLAERAIRGDLQVFSYKVAERLTEKIEIKYSLPGLWSGLAPIIEKEIRRSVPRKKLIIPKNLAEVLQYVTKK